MPVNGHIVEVHLIALEVKEQVIYELLLVSEEKVHMSSSNVVRCEQYLLCVVKNNSHRVRVAS